MQNYKDLKVWEKAHLFTLTVYEVSKAFPKEEIYSLTNQLRRAASSIPANIAEGCGKNSPAEFAHYLNIALGSANESGQWRISRRRSTGSGRISTRSAKRWTRPKAKLSANGSASCFRRWYAKRTRWEARQQMRQFSARWSASRRSLRGFASR